MKLVRRFISNVPTLLSTFNGFTIVVSVFTNRFNKREKMVVKLSFFYQRHKITLFIVIDIMNNMELTIVLTQSNFIIIRCIISRNRFIAESESTRKLEKIASAEKEQPPISTE